MEVSALKYSGTGGLHARSPLLRLQSDERLISLIRRGNGSAFETLVGRYNARLLAFCRHFLVSREDAEDVLQEVLAAAFNAIQADDRPIHVRPWLYRIARNRCLNHLRRVQPIGVDSMDVHLSDHGASTADKVHDRERFRLLVDDIQRLPETQRSALVLREMDALSYEQIAEAMETTVSGVKSLLVRARISLAEAAEARQLGCPQVRLELAEVSEGLSRRPSPLVRRHLRSCGRCSTFERQLKHTKKGLAALLPLGGLSLVRKLALLHVGHSAGTGSGAGGTAGVSRGVGGATAGGAGGVSAGTAGGVGAGTAGGVSAGTAGGMTAAGTAGGVTAGTAGGVTAGGVGITAGGATGISATAVGGVATGTSGGLLTAGAGVIATKAAAGLAAAALVTAGAIGVTHHSHHATHASGPQPHPAAVHKSAPPSAIKPVTPPAATHPKATVTTTRPAPVTTTTAAPTTTTTTATTPTTTTPTTTSTTASSQTPTDSVSGAQGGSASGSTGSTGTASDPGSGTGTGSTGQTTGAGSGPTGGIGSTGAAGSTGSSGAGSGGSGASSSGGSSASGSSGSGAASSTSAP